MPQALKIRNALITLCITVASVLLAAPPASATVASPPTAPARVLELLEPGGARIEWTSIPGATAYEVAPVRAGAPCLSCADVNTVRAPKTTIMLGQDPNNVRNWEVRAESPAGTSAWSIAQIPNQVSAPVTSAPAPHIAYATPAAKQTPYTAYAPESGSFSTPLSTPPSGYTRVVARDSGLSAPTKNYGDMWVFGDTGVIDTPIGSVAGSGSTIECVTKDGTAAMAAPSLSPSLDEATQPVTAAEASGGTGCFEPPAAGATEPYQLQGTYTYEGDTCLTWANGLTNVDGNVNPASNTVMESYSPQCITPTGGWGPDLGTFVSQYTVSSQSGPIQIPLEAQSHVQLPITSCPATDFTSYNGGTNSPGSWGAMTEYNGYYYFFNAYSNSQTGFVALGYPGQTCSAMGIARVPSSEVYVSGDYQFLLPGNRWVSSAESGQSEQSLASQASNILPFGYVGSYSGDVSVGRLANGTFVMVTILPQPTPAGAQIAVRTSSTPWGPWSTPVDVYLAGFVWGGDYAVNLHPDISGTGILPISYAHTTTDGKIPVQVVRIDELPLNALSGTKQPDMATGYWEVASDGGIFSFGDAQFYGSMGGHPLNKPIVGMAAVPGGGGYWEVASDGGIFSFGDAQFYGSMGGHPLNKPIVGMAATPDGKGYWEVASDGGIFSFGDAQFYGSMGGHPLNKPVVGMAATPDGKGYWEVASDGGIFSFGDAQFYGSAGGTGQQDVVAMSDSPAGGYWIANSAGMISAYGVPSYGSMSGRPLNRPIVGMAATTAVPA